MLARCGLAMPPAMQGSCSGLSTTSRSEMTEFVLFVVAPCSQVRRLYLRGDHHASRIVHRRTVSQPAWRPCFPLDSGGGHWDGSAQEPNKRNLVLYRRVLPPTRRDSSRNGRGWIRSRGPTAD